MTFFHVVRKETFVIKRGRENATDGRSEEGKQSGKVSKYLGLLSDFDTIDARGECSEISSKLFESLHPCSQLSATMCLSKFGGYGLWSWKKIC